MTDETNIDAKPSDRWLRVGTPRVRTFGLTSAYRMVEFAGNTTIKIGFPYRSDGFVGFGIYEFYVWELNYLLDWY